MTLTERERAILSGDSRRLLARATPLSTIGDIASSALGGAGPETVAWSTASDWDAAVAESFVDHPSGTVNMIRGVDKYDGLSNGGTIPSIYNTSGDSRITNSKAYSGNLSITTGNGFGISGLSNTDKTLSWVCQETSNISGWGLKLRNTNGQKILTFGSNNPQVKLESNNNNSETIISSPSPSYAAWRRFTVEIDFSTNTFDFFWEDLTGSSSDQSKTGQSLVSGASALGKWELEKNPWGGGPPEDGKFFIDNAWGVYSTSSITTATKSFSGSVSPDLTDLQYALNGASISLDIIGSPGTSSEEVITQSLGGASSYTLSWGSTHTDFRAKATLSSPSRGPSSLPTLGQVKLVA